MPFFRPICLGLLLAALALPAGKSLAQSPDPTPTGDAPTQTASPELTAAWQYFLPSVVRQRSSAPLYATSLYVDSADPRKLYDAGCALGLRDASLPGRQDSLVVLAFGQGWREENDSGGYDQGVWLFSPVYRFVGMPEISSLAARYADGYWDCTGLQDQQSTVTLAIGTSNFGPYGEPTTRDVEIRTARAAEHGKAWAAMVDSLATRLQPYARQIIVTGASDIEGSWNRPEVAYAWTRAYDQNNPRRIPYFNFGSCDGCPTEAVLTWRHSSNGWSQGDVYHVSWAVGTAFPVPEIYGTSGVHARQWQAVSKWGALYHPSRQAMQISGVMTQMQACQQVSGGCPYLDNTPEQGWDWMYTTLLANSYTQQKDPRWSTDIRWLVPR